MLVMKPMGQDETRDVNDQLMVDHLEWMKLKDQRPTEVIKARRVVLGLFNTWSPYGIAYAATEQIRAWLQELREPGKGHPGGHSPHTLFIYDYHLRGFYLWACSPEASDYGAVLDGNPMAALPRPKRPQCIPKPISNEELAALLRYVPEPVLTAVLLAAFAGLRRTEICNARREHVTQEFVLVPNGKGGKAGVVPTHPELWKHVRDKAPGYLVPKRRGGGRYSPATLSCMATEAFDAALATAGVDSHATLHQHRHWFGTTAYEESHDLLAVSRAMRHTNTRTTEGYIRVADSSIRAAVGMLPVPGTGPASL